MSEQQVLPVPEVYRDKRGDWTEDASHENGNYSSRCCYCERTFVGHKRRVVCKLCAILRGKEDESNALRASLAQSEAELCEQKMLLKLTEDNLKLEEATHAGHKALLQASEAERDRLQGEGTRAAEELTQAREELPDHYEYSTIANWRSQQVESARAAGCEFAEPGTTCVNKLAETLRADLSRERELNQGLRQVVKQYRTAPRIHLIGTTMCMNDEFGDTRCSTCIKADSLLESKPVVTTEEQASNDERGVTTGA